MDPVIRGRVAVWGIESDGDTYAAGLITGQRRENQAQEDFCFDQNGFTVSQIFFDQNNVCSVDVIVESGTDLPDVGDDVTIAGLACIVQAGVSKVWEQKGWCKISIPAKKFENLSEA